MNKLQFIEELTEEVEQELKYLFECVSAIMMVEKALELGYKNKEIEELYKLLDTYGWEDNWTNEAWERYLELLEKYFKFLFDNE